MIYNSTELKRPTAVPIMVEFLFLPNKIALGKVILMHFHIHMFIIAYYLSNFFEIHLKIF